MSKTGKSEKNSYPCGACIVLRQREREREEGRKGEKTNSIVNKISANKGKNFGRKEMVKVREFETVSREAREDLRARLLTSFGYFLEWDQAMYSGAICRAKGGANAKALS